MAHSNYKVLTDVDLSNNKLYNTLCIANTEKDGESLLTDPEDSEKLLIQTGSDSRSLLVRTDGDTVLTAANLTGKVINGKTSLKTKDSEITVTNTAKETITTSKTTTVATNTTETINSSGISVKTPSQTVVATAGSKVESPEITLVTGTPEGTDNNKQAKITLTKTVGMDNSAIAASAKEITVDANVTGGSIIQTAPTSTYRADKSEVNSLKLTTDSVKIKSDNETITLAKAKDETAAQTEIHSNNLVVNATAVRIKENTTTSIEASNSVSVGVGAGDPPPTTIAATASDVAIKSNKVTITGRNTVDAIKLAAESTSVSVLPQQIKLDSDGGLLLKSDEGIAVNDLKSATFTAPIISEKATTSSEVKSPSITLATGPFSDTDSAKQASLTLTKTANIDDSTITTSAKIVTVAATNITQTASTSTYEADDSNKLELRTDSAKITSGTETITLAKAKDETAAKTTISSDDLIASATKVTVENNTTTSVISSGSVTVTARSSDGTSSVTTKPAKIDLESKEISLTASVTESESKKSSRIALSPAASAKEAALALSTDKNLKINSVSGVTIEDSSSIALVAPTITSEAKIVAKKTLEVTETSTFNGGAVVKNSLNLTGVTIKWDSTLGALTFSKG